MSLTRFRFRQRLQVGMDIREFLIGDDGHPEWRHLAIGQIWREKEMNASSGSAVRAMTAHLLSGVRNAGP